MDLIKNDCVEITKRLGRQLLYLRPQSMYLREAHSLSLGGLMLLMVLAKALKKCEAPSDKELGEVVAGMLMLYTKVGRAKSKARRGTPKK